MINLILHVSDGSNMASTIASWFSDEINFRDLTMEAVRLHQKSDLFNFLKGYMKFPRSIGQLRPYLPENTRSRSIPEVKLVRALLVLRFVRTWESRGAVVFVDPFSPSFLHILHISSSNIPGDG